MMTVFLQIPCKTPGFCKQGRAGCAVPLLTGIHFIPDEGKTALGCTPRSKTRFLSHVKELSSFQISVTWITCKQETTPPSLLPKPSNTTTYPAPSLLYGHLTVALICEPETIRLTGHTRMINPNGAFICLFDSSSVHTDTQDGKSDGRCLHTHKLASRLR